MGAVVGKAGRHGTKAATLHRSFDHLADRAFPLGKFPENRENIRELFYSSDP
jgi:hypothetical protein